MLKRLFDVTFAVLGIVLLSPILVATGLLVKCTSPGSIVFGHERAGRGGERFRVYKFRTMVQDASRIGGPLTLGGQDPRITRVGHWLRRTKLDELPQLFNVLWGQMSLVGPRPEAWRYVEMFPDEFAEILRVRPGITDPASIEFRDEASLLASAEDPEREYVEHILPTKIGLAKSYLAEQSLVTDCVIIIKTLRRLVVDRLSSSSDDPKPR